MIRLPPDPNGIAALAAAARFALGDTHHVSRLLACAASTEASTEDRHNARKAVGDLPDREKKALYGAFMGFREVA